MKTCEDCGDNKPLPFYADPRDPPLDEGECLCSDCFKSATIEVLEDEASQLVYTIEAAISVIGRKSVRTEVADLIVALRREDLL